MHKKAMCQLLRDWQSVNGPPVVATIGNFDGLHLGHQALIQKVIELGKSQGMATMLIAFEPYPIHYFAKYKKPYRLMRFRDKFEAIQHKFNYVVALRFNAALANLPATNFIEHCLQKALNVRALVVGEDFRFGAAQGGDVNLLLAKQCENFQIHVIPQVCQYKKRISSSLVRQSLVEGDIDTAQSMLGHPFYVSARIVRGQGRGQGLGFATANLNISDAMVVPHGVYLTQIQGNFGRYHAITHVGARPTFGEFARGVESHLIDYSGNLYGQRVKCTFIKKIRTEIKFSSTNDLAQQIQKDLAVARQILASQVSI